MSGAAGADGADRCRWLARSRLRCQPAYRANVGSEQNPAVVEPHCNLLRIRYKPAYLAILLANVVKAPYGRTRRVSGKGLHGPPHRYRSAARKCYKKTRKPLPGLVPSINARYDKGSRRRAGRSRNAPTWGFPRGGTTWELSGPPACRSDGKGRLARSSRSHGFAQKRLDKVGWRLWRCLKAPVLSIQKGMFNEQAGTD
jgi:hypothetical protein